MKKAHSFHIPVMGIGFTIDSPLKVAQYGIDSVISLVDDILLEKLRKMYCELHEMPYKEITDKIEFNLKYIDNMGKGPIGSNNLSQNRDYLIAEIGYKF